MKKKFIVTPIFLFFVLTCKVFGVSQPLTAGNSNYVVIGAFAVQKNAAKFIKQAEKLNFEAEFDLNPTRKLYYVYVLHTGDSSVANSQARKIRTETPFNDTWVYRGFLGADAEKGTDVNPVTQQSLSSIQPIDNSEPVTEPEKIVTPVVEIPVVENPAPVVEKKIETPINTVPVEGAKSFFFKLISDSGKELKGDVDVVDADRLSKAATYEANKQVYIKPINKSGKMTLISEVFGYRKVQRDINYNLPDSSAGVVVDQGNMVIPFEMVPLCKSMCRLVVPMDSV